MNANSLGWILGILALFGVWVWMVGREVLRFLAGDGTDDELELQRADR